MWVRGLKLTKHLQEEHPSIVAPYVGAWIETFDGVILSKSEFVAPYVGAWIETLTILLS